MAFISEIIRDAGIKRPTLASTIFALVFAISFGTGGIAVFTSEFLNPYLESREARDWTSVDATVLKSEIKRNDDSTSINLAYRYSFQGSEYQGDRFELSDASRNFSTQTYKETAKDYPKGSQIPIWINPNNPEQSVFKRNMVITNWIALPFSIPFITIGLCALSYALLNGTAFRIQTQAWKEAAHIASRYSAFEINQALLDEDFNNRPRAEINFLKRSSILTSIAFLFMIIFINGITSVFLILNVDMHLTGNPLAYPLSIFLIPFVIIGLVFIRKFLTSLTAGKGDDYVIISEWDYEYTQVTHHWLLLSAPRDALEIGIFTCATQKSKELKKILRKNPFKDIFKAPDKSMITGTIVHPISGSPKKEINLLIYTINKPKKRYSKHELKLYTPDND